MGLWHPDLLLPPWKCILICYQLPCERSKLFSSHWISLGGWWLFKNPSSSLLAVTLYSGEIQWLLRKSQAEQPDNSWLSGQEANSVHPSQNQQQSLFSSSEWFVTFAFCIPHAGQITICLKVAMSFCYLEIEKNPCPGKRKQSLIWL